MDIPASIPKVGLVLVVAVLLSLLTYWAAVKSGLYRRIQPRELFWIASPILSLAISGFMFGAPLFGARVAADRSIDLIVCGALYLLLVYILCRVERTWLTRLMHTSQQEEIDDITSTTPSGN